MDAETIEEMYKARVQALINALLETARKERKEGNDDFACGLELAADIATFRRSHGLL